MYIKSLKAKEDIPKAHYTAQEQAVNSCLDTIETITNQIDYIYIVSNIENSRYDDYSYEEFRCDALGELAQTGEQIDELSTVNGDNDNS